MGSYEIAPEQALESSIRMIKEGRVQSVKLEGGAHLAPIISRITSTGIPVLVHVGLTPQRQNSLGGFRVQGKTCTGALEVMRDALAVQESGAFAVVLEAVLPEVAAMITKRLRIPTIGIGAGNQCSGQVLVQIDMNGSFPPGRFLPKFVTKYGDVWGESMRAMETYRGICFCLDSFSILPSARHVIACIPIYILLTWADHLVTSEVKSRTYPAPEHTYPIATEELRNFEKCMEEVPVSRI